MPQSETYKLKKAKELICKYCGMSNHPECVQCPVQITTIKPLTEDETPEEEEDENWGMEE